MAAEQHRADRRGYLNNMLLTSGRYILYAGARSRHFVDDWHCVAYAQACAARGVAREKARFCVCARCALKRDATHGIPSV